MIDNKCEKEKPKVCPVYTMQTDNSYSQYQRRAKDKEENNYILKMKSIELFKVKNS